MQSDRQVCKQLQTLTCSQAGANRFTCRQTDLTLYYTVPPLLYFCSERCMQIKHSSGNMLECSSIKNTLRFSLLFHSLSLLLSRKHRDMQNRVLRNVHGAEASNLPSIRNFLYLTASFNTIDCMA